MEIQDSGTWIDIHHRTIPQGVRDLIKSKWNALVEDTVNELVHAAIPRHVSKQTAQDKQSILESMWSTPPPHDYEKSVELNFNRTLDELKEIMRNDHYFPPEVHAKLMADYNSTFSEPAYDPVASGILLGGGEGGEPEGDAPIPPVVLKIAQTRVHVQDLAKLWVGTTVNNNATGALLAFYSSIQKRVKEMHENVFEEFAFGKLGEEDMKTIVGIFGERYADVTKEREKLTEEKKLLTEMADLLKQFEKMP